MKKIGLVFMIILATLSAAIAQKMDRTDAIMANKEGNYTQAMRSIEKCINHPNFYNLSHKDRALAWLYRSIIYANVSTLPNASLICPNSLAIAEESLQKCKRTDTGVVKEFSNDIQALEALFDNMYYPNASAAEQLPKEEPHNQVQGYGETALEQTIIRWDVQSRPQGADIFWRVVSKTPEVKSTNNKYLQTTPYEATKSLDIKGLTYQTSGDVRIILRCEKDGYHSQEKEYNVRMIIDQEEISAFFRLVKEEE